VAGLKWISQRNVVEVAPVDLSVGLHAAYLSQGVGWAPLADRAEKAEKEQDN
jgi:hypothetical protein